MTKEQEEFDRLRKRLYELADKMGMRLTMLLKNKKPTAPAKPREPGEE
jgi:hypothetical protein